MRYLIIHKGKVFYTSWFDVENFFAPGMIVIDLAIDRYFVGGGWIEIEEDSL